MGEDLKIRENITKNLNYVSKRMGVKNNRLLLMYQTHSNKVIIVNKKNLKKVIKSDAMITKVKKSH